VKESEPVSKENVFASNTSLPSASKKLEDEKSVKGEEEDSAEALTIKVTPSHSAGEIVSRVIEYLLVHPEGVVIFKNIDRFKSERKGRRERRRERGREKERGDSHFEL
jgi:hypothetical protein